MGRFTLNQTLDSIAAWRHSRAEGTTMAHIDRNVRIYHVLNPTGEQLLGLQAPRWPDAYTLAASFPDPGLPPEDTLAMAFKRTQQDHPLIHTVRWNPGARRRSTSPGDVVVLSTGQAFRCNSIGWQPLEQPAPGFWTSLVSCYRSGPRSIARWPRKGVEGKPFIRLT